MTSVDKALQLARNFGSTDGEHHKAWVIDQMVRKLLVTSEAYTLWVAAVCAGEDGPQTYDWDPGIAP